MSISGRYVLALPAAVAGYAVIAGYALSYEKLSTDGLQMPHRYLHSLIVKQEHRGPARFF